MNKKINIDSGDTLSDHAKRSIVSYPEIKKLHLTNMLNHDVLQFIQAECKNFDGKRPTIIVTSSVSEAFDIVMLLQAVLGEQNVRAFYPHADDSNNINTSVVVIPIVTFQLSKTLSAFLLNPVNCLIVNHQDNIEHMSHILKVYLGQLPEDCKILQLHAKQISEKVKIVPKPRMKMIVEVEPEPESAKKSAFEFIIEPIEEVEISTIPTNIGATSSMISEIASDEILPEHHIVFVDRNFKRSYLRNRLKSSNKKTLVITRTRHNAHRLEEYLYQGKVRSRILHANLTEEAKDKVIERFVSGDLSVLLLPEAVAQTINLDCVSDIIFFDLPDVGLEFQERISSIGERFNVVNTSSLVTLDEVPWIESMEAELKWKLPKVQPLPPQRSHNILRIKGRSNTNKEAPENTEKRVGVNRGLRKLGGKNNLHKKRTNPMMATKPAKDSFNDHSTVSHVSDDPFNSVNQSIVNENRNPFAFDSFEASISRQNKQRVKQMFSRKEKPLRDVPSDFSAQKPEKKSVKIVHRKKRTFDVDGNQ